MLDFSDQRGKAVLKSRKSFHRLREASDLALLLINLVSSRNGLLHCLHPLSNDVLAILAHLVCKSHGIFALKNLLDLLKRQPRDLRVEENNQNPADAADGGVEAECSRRCHTLHHTQESRRDDDV